MEKLGITLTKANAVADIEFYYPPHNSLTNQGMREMAAKIDELAADSSIHIIRIQSGGERTFCAGANFQELMDAATNEQAVHFFEGFAVLFTSMLACPKMILSRVQGKAVGGAVGIIACSDLSYATKNASIKLSELDVGIGPFVVGPLIEHKIGRGRLNQLAFSPKQFFSAEWAGKVGLYAEIFETTHQLDSAFEEKSNELLSYNPNALTQIKKVMQPNVKKLEKLLHERKKLSAELLVSEFTRNRLASIMKN